MSGKVRDNNLRCLGFRRKCRDTLDTPPDLLAQFPQVDSLLGLEVELCHAPHAVRVHFTDACDPLKRLLYRNQDPFLDILGSTSPVGNLHVDDLPAGIGRNNLKGNPEKRAMEPCQQYRQQQQVGSNAIVGKPANHLLRKGAAQGLRPIRSPPWQTDPPHPRRG